MIKIDKVTTCQEWLAYCLLIGWSVDTLPGLEKIWDQTHDKDGNLIPPTETEGETGEG